MTKLDKVKCIICIYLRGEHISMVTKHRTVGYLSGGGQVVKLLASGARGPGFDSPLRHLTIRDWLSPASKSRYG